jgi:hypothetical protein
VTIISKGIFDDETLVGIVSIQTDDTVFDKLLESTKYIEYITHYWVFDANFKDIGQSIDENGDQTMPSSSENILSIFNDILYDLNQKDLNKNEKGEASYTNYNNI